MRKFFFFYMAVPLRCRSVEKVPTTSHQRRPILTSVIAHGHLHYIPDLPRADFPSNLIPDACIRKAGGVGSIAPKGTGSNWSTLNPPELLYPKLQVESYNS